MLSMYDDVQYVRNALNAGISGYILKNALETDLIRAVRAVAAGKRVPQSGARGGVDGPPAAEAAPTTTASRSSARAKSRCCG